MKEGVLTTGSVKIEKLFSLEDGQHLFQFETQSDEIGLHLTNFEDDEVFKSPVHTSISLNKTLNTYYVQIESSTEAEFICDRCLEPVVQTIEGSYALVLSENADTDTAGSHDEMRRVNLNRNEVTLDDDVVNTILLALPHKTVCSEECRGLCDQCGANLNKDSCEHLPNQENNPN